MSLYLTECASEALFNSLSPTDREHFRLTTFFYDDLERFEREFTRDRFFDQVGASTSTSSNSDVRIELMRIFAGRRSADPRREVEFNTRYVVKWELPERDSLRNFMVLAERVESMALRGAAFPPSFDMIENLCSEAPADKRQALRLAMRRAFERSISSSILSTRYRRRTQTSREPYYAPDDFFRVRVLHSLINSETPTVVVMLMPITTSLGAGAPIRDYFLVPNLWTVSNTPRHSSFAGGTYFCYLSPLESNFEGRTSFYGLNPALVVTNPTTPVPPENFENIQAMGITIPSVIAREQIFSRVYAGTRYGTFRRSPVTSTWFPDQPVFRGYFGTPSISPPAVTLTGAPGFHIDASTGRPFRGTICYVACPAGHPHVSWTTIPIDYPPPQRRDLARIDITADTCSLAHELGHCFLSSMGLPESHPYRIREEDRVPTPFIGCHHVSKARAQNALSYLHNFFGSAGRAFLDPHAESPTKYVSSYHLLASVDAFLNELARTNPATNNSALDSTFAVLNRNYRHLRTINRSEAGSFPFSPTLSGDNSDNFLGDRLLRCLASRYEVLRGSSTDSAQYDRFQRLIETVLVTGFDNTAASPMVPEGIGSIPFGGVHEHCLAADLAEWLFGLGVPRRNVAVHAIRPGASGDVHVLKRPCRMYDWALHHTVGALAGGAREFMRTITEQKAEIFMDQLFTTGSADFGAHDTGPGESTFVANSNPLVRRRASPRPEPVIGRTTDPGTFALLSQWTDNEHDWFDGMNVDGWANPEIVFRDIPARSEG
jgi:hypothetical protein